MENEIYKYIPELYDTKFKGNIWLRALVGLLAMALFGLILYIAISLLNKFNI